MTIQTESPRAADVVALLEAHLAFARSVSPPGHAHALDLRGLMSDDITFCTARLDGQLMGIGAVRALDADRAEIKSMHTVAAARGHGLGRRMVEHLTALAAQSGASWLGLETGKMDEFAPARYLYEALGFEVCEPFDSYTDNPFSLCMSKELVARN